MKQNHHGFTLAETLITVALLGIIFGVSVGGISAMSTSYRNITKKSEAQIAMSTAISLLSADLRTVTDIQTENGKTYYYCTSRNRFVRYETESIMNSIAVVPAKQVDGKLVEEDSIELLPSRSVTNGLDLQLDEIGYDPITQLIRFTVSVHEGNSSAYLEQQEIVLRPYCLDFES